MISQRFSELKSAIDSCSYLTQGSFLSESEALILFHEVLLKTRSQGGIVYVIGNGGSAGIASHFSNDLMKALQIPSQTLYDSNLMTCLSNDIGYENVFSYQLERLAKPKDLLIAISSSGRSPNILKAVQVCSSRDIPIITLSGFEKSNPLSTLGHLNIWVDREDYGIVECAHFFLLHAVVDLWNKTLSETATHG